MNPPRSDDVVHIINAFHNPHGGSEQEALYLAALLGTTHTVKLWSSSSRSSPDLTRTHRITRLGLAPSRHPNGGTYVFVGAHWRNRLWPFLAARPRRLVYVFNTFHPRLLELTSRHPPLLRWPETEYVFISEFQKRQVGVEGVVQPSPIDLARFQPAARAAARDRLAIGRMSRDTPDKHDNQDLALYREWAAQGIDVRLQGGTCLASGLQVEPSIQLLQEGALPAGDFLHSLDIFYYRTGAHVETFGRVVFEAMACGLPVVCHRRGGYSDWIRHGENGFLFDTTDEARALVATLIADPALRASIGARARQTVEALYSGDALRSRAAFFTGARATDRA